MVSTARRSGTSSTGRPVEPRREDDGAVQSRRMLRYDGHPELARAIDGQRGLVRTASPGHGDDSRTPYRAGPDRRVGAGPSRRLHPGAPVAALDPTTAKRERRAGAHLQIARAHVLSHESAARERECPPNARPRPHPLTRLGARAAGSSTGSSTTSRRTSPIRWSGSRASRCWMPPARQSTWRASMASSTAPSRATLPGSSVYAPRAVGGSGPDDGRPRSPSSADGDVPGRPV